MDQFRLIYFSVPELFVGAYVFVAVRNKKPSKLKDGIAVFINVCAGLGAIHLSVLVFGGEWNLSTEAAGVVIIGSMSIAWFAVETVYEIFGKLKPRR